VHVFSRAIVIHHVVLPSPTGDWYLCRMVGSLSNGGTNLSSSLSGNQDPIL